jgi:hypothetical protein
MRLFLITVLGLLAVGLAAAGPASADCPSPSMTFFPRDVDRGGEVIATGKYWGDNCYDTGPPPDGQGDLGEPLDGIQIVLVQGEREWVVGTVDAGAGDDYGFVTRIVVPRDAAPGDAQLLVRRPETYLFVSNPDPMLGISSAPPIDAPPSSRSEPGRTPVASGDAGAENVDDSTVGWSWVTGIAVGAAVFAAGAVTAAVRRRST